MAAVDIITGALVGGASSLVVGGALLFVRRSFRHRDRTDELATTLAGVSSSVAHISRQVDKVDSKLDSLPCHNYCPPGGDE